MLAAGLKDAANRGDQSGLDHRVVETSGLVLGAQVSGCEVVDRCGWDVIGNVLEVFTNWVVGILKRDDMDRIGCEFF